MGNITFGCGSNNSKKLFELVAFAKDENYVVVEVKEPQYVVETSEDRAKATLLKDFLDDSELNWNVKVLRVENF